ncbi:MAG: DeoR/GlpR transcriptional regulator [Chitinophagaceae bacterium]|nr:DeoR/GlpR transcriptional regulator [Chitinophagaceae bacterium]
MLKSERQELILHEINLHNKVLVGDLSTAIKVSEDTIRRDLIELAQKGKLVKVHGGALSNSFRNAFTHADIYSLEQKKIIAHKAISLIRQDMLIHTTGGTTILEMARLLPENLKATFVTGSLQAAFEYLQHPNIDVILVGDRVSRNSQITVGGDAVAKIKRFHADLCFLGVNAIDVKHGITDSDYEIAQVKQAILESSSRVVVLSIAEKLNTRQKMQVCPIENVHTLITELPPNDPFLKPYQEKGIQVI